MIDIDRILTGKIAHMQKAYAPTKKDETYCCALCPYGDSEDCEVALENDISELQRLIDNNAGVKLDQIRYEGLKLSNATRQQKIFEDCHNLQI